MLDDNPLEVFLLICGTQLTQCFGQGNPPFPFHVAQCWSDLLGGYQ